MFLPVVKVFHHPFDISQKFLVSLLLLLVLKCPSLYLLKKFNRSRKEFSNVLAVPFQAWHICVLVGLQEQQTGCHCYSHKAERKEF